ncbi:MAG: dihydrofolate reductase [bacterium]|nr:dihydrofolate reductase [bacterium]
MKKPLITEVVAIGRNRELGKNDKLLWHIPDDLKRFKRLTLGHPIIMGRKTFESIVGYIGEPLPGRTNIIVTRQTSKFIADNPYLLIRANKQIVGNTNLSAQDGVIVVSSIEEGIEKAREENPKEIHIGGGAEIYEQALPYIDKLQLTIIDDEKPADTFFPPYEHIFTKKVFEESREWNGIKYKWIDLERD